MLKNRLYSKEKGRSDATTVCFIYSIPIEFDQTNKKKIILFNRNWQWQSIYLYTILNLFNQICFPVQWWNYIHKEYTKYSISIF